MTAALHALILIFFYLLISGLGYPGLVVFEQSNIFLIKNKQQEPYTSSKQQERHNKHTVLESLYNFLVAALPACLFRIRTRGCWYVPIYGCG